MLTKISVPKLGMVQEDISVVEWLVKDEEVVKRGQPIVIIETAKTSYTIEAEEAGVVTIFKKVGEFVKIGDELGIISNISEKNEIMGKPGNAQELKPIGDKEKKLENNELNNNTGQENIGDKEIKAIIPVIGIRKTIADNLMKTIRETASQTIVAEADLTELRSYIALLQENENVEKIKINSAFIKLIIKVLEEYPIFNSIERDSKIIIYKKYNIGMAVMSGGYLKVPVIKDAGSKNLSEINAEIIKIIEKAKNNELKEENFRDGTFTFSNAGINEVDIVTPIINHPQKAIIAVSRIAVKPSIYNGEIRPRVMTNLCLTYDHRIIDGANAGLFISRFKEIIQSGELIGEILS